MQKKKASEMWRERERENCKAHLDATKISKTEKLTSERRCWVVDSWVDGSYLLILSLLIWLWNFLVPNVAIQNQCIKRKKKKKGWKCCYLNKQKLWNYILQRNLKYANFYYFLFWMVFSSTFLCFQTVPICCSSV